MTETNAERLEKVKVTFGDKFIHKDIAWLIEQAERVQELEDLCEHRLKMLKYSRVKNNHYRKALGFYAEKGNNGTEIARQALEQSK